MIELCVSGQLNAVVQEYLMGEFTRSKLSRYHVNWKLAHLHLARSCMCYISICLNHSRIRGRTSSTISPDRGDHLDIMSQPLRDYTLDHGPDHFSYLGPHIESILHDIKVLERDIQTHPRMWDNMCLSANRDMHCTTPCWPTSRHEVALFILVAFSPNSVLRKFLRHTELEPKEGRNPLVCAAYFNKHEHACTLLSRGARLNHRGWDTSGFCQVLPIEVAFQNQHYDLVTLFVTEGSPVPLLVFRMLYHRGYDDKIPSSAMKILLQTDDFAEAVISPLKESFSRPPTLFNHSPLAVINEQDLIDIIQRFIPFRLDALLHIAVERGCVAVAHYLLSIGVPFPSGLLLTLWYSRTENPATSIRFLVENGANTRAHTSNGSSVLHLSLAALKEDEALEIARFLVVHGCDPLEANFRGETPLYIAIRKGYVSVVHYFLSLGAPLPFDLLAILSSRWSNNRPRMIRYFIEHAVTGLPHTSERDSVFRIALAAFGEHDTLETAKLLVDHGHNPLRDNSVGKSLLCSAVKRGHVSVAHFLLTLGARFTSDELILWISRGMEKSARMIRFLVENGFDALVRTTSGDSLLHIAIRDFREDDVLETTRLLVARGCRPLQANSHGETPLRIALEEGHVSVVHYFLSLGVPLPSNLLGTLNFWGTNSARMIRCLIENEMNTLTSTHNRHYVLHQALSNLNEHDALETTKLLVAYGCNPLEANPFGDTPFRTAIQRGHISVVQYLLSLGIPLPSDLIAILDLQGMKKPARMIRFLVENGLEADALDRLLHIILATFGEHDALEVAKLLAAHGCDPLQADCDGHTPLCIAVQRGHISVACYFLSLGAPLPSDLVITPNMPEGARMIRFLVENDFDVLSRAGSEDSLLHIVAENVDEAEVLETMKLLVTRGCNLLQPNSRGKTPVCVAIEWGHVYLASYLLSLDVPLPGDALFIALDGRRLLEDPRGRSKMVHFLVNQGANIFTTRSNGDSVLHGAIMSFSHFPNDDPEVLDVITYLVACGCDPAMGNTHGVTPLHLAVKQGNSMVVKCLLSLNAPLPPDILFTAIENDLRVISTSKMIEVIKVLVAAGCDTRVRDKAGHTPLYAAVIKGHVSVAKYLVTVIDSPPVEEMLSAAALAPANVRSEAKSLANGCLQELLSAVALAPASVRSEAM